MRTISVRKGDLTTFDTDTIVNAANEGLMAGGGVCGAIFRAAGVQELQEACDRIGHCDTGSAVITPGFRLKAKYVIHAVGPVWSGGRFGEADKLRGAYRSSLERAKENGCASIGFPLISAGIFGYPADLAWKEAVCACREGREQNPETDIDIVFADLDDRKLAIGREALQQYAADFSDK